MPHLAIRNYVQTFTSNDAKPKKKLKRGYELIFRNLTKVRFDHPQSADIVLLQIFNQIFV